MPALQRACGPFLFLSALLAGLPARGSEAPTYDDRAASAGLTVVTRSGSGAKPHILESAGNGVLVLDYDGDGYLDVFMVAAHPIPRPPGGEGEGSRLYRNRGDGTFADVTERSGAGLDLYGSGGCVGDADGDGLPDLYVTAFGPNVLLRNRGEGTFEAAPEAAGVADPGWSIGCAFLDAEGDGDHDLYVANYVEATWEEVLAARRTRLWRGAVMVMDGPRGLPEAANRFYRNEGAGPFVDATAASGLADGARGYSMAVAALDLEPDGDADLFVANDSTPNRLYRNRGDGTFEEIGTWAGVAYDGDGDPQGSMGVGVGDLDGDGRVDLVVTNFAHDHYTHYRNLDGELFADVSFPTGIATATYVPLGWAALPFDADRDGDLDLFLANGHIYPQVDEDPALGEGYRQRNQLLLNDGGRFREVTAQAGPGLAVVESSRGAATLDVEEDGDLDVVVSNQDAAPSLLVARGGGGSGWLAVDLVARDGLGPALGAEVAVEAAGRRQVRQVVSGGSYASQGDLRAFFGLGPAKGAAVVSIRWPGGRARVYRNLPGGRAFVVPPPPAGKALP